MSTYPVSLGSLPVNALDAGQRLIVYRERACRILSLDPCSSSLLRPRLLQIDQVAPSYLAVHRDEDLCSTPRNGTARARPCFPHGRQGRRVEVIRRRLEQGVSRSRLAEPAGRVGLDLRHLSRPAVLLLEDGYASNLRSRMPASVPSGKQKKWQSKALLGFAILGEIAKLKTKQANKQRARKSRRQGTGLQARPQHLQTLDRGVALFGA